MVERGEQMRLALEAGQPVGVRGDDLWQDLDRQIATSRLSEVSAAFQTTPIPPSPICSIRR
jgi:hypothetical protein